MKRKKFSYKKAGVDLSFANAIVPEIEALVRTTRRSEVLRDIGPFAALFKLKKHKNPVLVSSADGVGMKLEFALKLKKFDTIGIDLVAMNVNDVLAIGAEPLFFLDYIGIGSGQKQWLPELLTGMVEGCKRAGCSLVGGETAEMPSVYGGKRLGLSGFAVGVVSERGIIDGRGISEGDIVLGLASSGLHANGYSLVRKVLPPSLQLLEPTKIYVSSILAALRYPVHGLAHITGGGLYDNIERILPKSLNALIDSRAWEVPDVFKVIQKKSHLSKREMFQTFNMGVGFVCIVPPAMKEKVKRVLSRREVVFEIGEVVKGNGRVIIQ